MHYIIEADDPTRTAIESMTPTNTNLTQIVIDEEGRTTPLHVVAEFYDEQLQTEFPQLLPWEHLTDYTRTGIALIMAGYIAWQFPQHYDLDLTDTYSDVITAHPEATGQAGPVESPGPAAKRPEDEVLSIRTVQNVVDCYISLQEGDAQGEDLPDWEKLPDAERTRLVEACRKALDLNPAAEIIDVLHSNIKWPEL